MSDQVESQLQEWGPGKTARGRARLPSSRRRERPQLSCNLCKRMKLRCDRQHPCGTCTQRALGPSCTYSPNVSQPVDGVQRHPTVQDRIQQLEGLVVDLMQKSTSQESSTSLGPTMPSVDRSAAAGLGVYPTDSSSPAVSDCGSMQLTSSGASYVNSAHWAAVLNGIAEIKEYLERDREEERAGSPLLDVPSHDQRGPQLLSGCTKLASKEEILESIPARPVIDRLVSRYFNLFESSPAVLHSVQFLKEYEEFWKDPSSTPVIWLGLLFTIMCLATQFQKFRLDPGLQSPETLSIEQDLEDTVKIYREKIVQCLILGNYAKGGPFVLETLMLYTAVELFLHNDAEIGIWILLGTIVQLAMHMGYHRDPKHFTGMSPFICEMRKRVWATVVELDLGVSVQMGLPRLIKQWQTNTGEPLNLQDRDFDKSTRDMPPSRPETDLTPMLYRLVKSRMMAAIGPIWDFASDDRPYTHTELMEMDKALEDARTSVPKCLKWQSMVDCILDSPQIIMQKISLEMMFHRARIVLHQKYLHCSPAMTQYQHSQQICLDAALELLEYQHVLEEETQPFCRLYQERWRVSSLVNHDFLLAASILCVYLQQDRDGINEDVEGSKVETMWASLRRSYNIWLRSSTSSKEAQKAAKALSVILRSQGVSNTEFDIGINLPPEQPFLSPYSNDSDYRQGNPTGFGVQFPILNVTALTSWSSPTDERFGDPLVAGAASKDEWQAMDDIDPITSLQWPYDADFY